MFIYFPFLEVGEIIGLAGLLTLPHDLWAIAFPCSYGAAQWLSCFAPRLVCKAYSSGTVRDSHPIPSWRLIQRPNRLQKYTKKSTYKELVILFCLYVRKKMYFCKFKLVYPFGSTKRVSIM